MDARKQADVIDVRHFSSSEESFMLNRRDLYSTRASFQETESATSSSKFVRRETNLQSIFAGHTSAVGVVVLVVHRT